MRVEKLMSRQVCTCSPSASLHDAARAMWDSDCGFLPVVDERNRVVGVVTDRDICMGAFTQGVPLTGALVASVMSSNVRSCSPRDDVARVEKLMQNHRVRRVPVIGPFRELVGVVTLADLARLSQSNIFRKARTGLAVAKTLAVLSEARVKNMAAAAE